MNVVTTELDHREAESAIRRRRSVVWSRDARRRWFACLIHISRSGIQGCRWCCISGAKRRATRFGLAPAPAAQTAGYRASRRKALFVGLPKDGRWRRDDYGSVVAVVAGSARAGFGDRGRGAGAVRIAGVECGFTGLRCLLRRVHLMPPFCGRHRCARRSGSSRRALRDFSLGLETRLSAAATTVFDHDSDYTQLVQDVLLSFV